MTLRHITLSLLLALCTATAAVAQSYADPMSDAMLTVYDQLLDDDPHDPETLSRRAALFYNKQDYVRALDDLNMAVRYYLPEQTEEIAQAKAMRAGVLMAMHKYDQAVTDLDELLAADPANYTLTHHRAMALYELGRYAESKADYNRMLRLSSRSQEAMLGLARVAVKENNLGTANELADRAVALTPADGAIYLQRASVRSLMGDRSGAVDDYISAISLDYDHTPMALRRLVELSREDYPTVIAGLSGAISKAPKNGMFLFIRAMIAQGHSNYLAAIADYDRIINEGLDSYPGINAALCECYYALGRYDVALINADYAISATDNNAWYYMLKSRVLRATKDYEGALEAATRALDKEPEMAEALVCKALALLPLGKSADAGIALSEATMSEPEDAAIGLLRGWVLADYRHQEANATACFERVLDMDYDFDNVRSLRGFAMLYLGRDDQAEAWMDRVLDTANDYDGEVNYYGACFYSHCGKMDRAFRCMEASLEKGYADYHDWTEAAEANINVAPMRDDPRFAPLLQRYGHLFR